MLFFNKWSKRERGFRKRKVQKDKGLDKEEYFVLTGKVKKL